MGLRYRASARPDTPEIEARVQVHDFREADGMRAHIVRTVMPSFVQRATDLRGYSPKTRHDQGGTGTCTANATTRALEIKRIVKYGHITHIPLSRAWLYFACREAMDPPEVDRDEGTHLALCADMLKRKGIPAEVPVAGRPAAECWPWKDDLDHLCTEPSWMAGRAAYVHKIETWSKIRTIGDDKLNDILVNFAVDNPVTIALPIDSRWNNPAPTEPLVAPVHVAGYHAVLLVGWDPSRSVFIMENSWGERWGDGGFGYLDPDYVLRNGFDLTAFQGGFEEWRQAA